MYESEIFTIKSLRDDLYIAREVALIMENNLRADFINAMMFDCNSLIKGFEILKNFEDGESEEE